MIDTTIQAMSDTNITCGEYNALSWISEELAYAKQVLDRRSTVALDITGIKTRHVAVLTDALEAAGLGVTGLMIAQKRVILAAKLPALVDEVVSRG